MSSSPRQMASDEKRTSTTPSVNASVSEETALHTGAGLGPNPDVEKGAISGGDTQCSQDVKIVERDGEGRRASPGDAEKADKENWKDEVQDIPYNNYLLVFPGLMLAVFLAALDQTIAAVALPTIVKEIGGVTGYSWVGSAYLLMCACMSPVYGKLTTIVGRKPLLFFAISMFLFGSAMCGAAQNFIWLALSRGVQGIGGGGIIPLVFIVISDIVPLRDRGKYGGLMAGIWGVASVVGPLVGGSLTDHVSWRWCFWINLPTGGLAMLLIFIFLHLPPVPNQLSSFASVRAVVRTFDFAGLVLLLGGIACLLVGFEFAETSWSSAQTIALLVVGVALLLCTAVNEMYTTRSPLIPPRLFRTRTTAGILIATLMHAITFFAGSYYAPLYFQVLGSSATLSGVRTMSFSFGSAVVAVLSGLVLTRWGRYKPVIVTGFTVMTAGFGGMIVMDERTSRAVQEITLLVAGIGVGCLFQPPLIALQAAMPIKEMPTSTGTFMLIRTLGGTIGVSIGNTIYASVLSRKLRSVTAQFPSFSIPSGDPVTGNISSLHSLTPPALRDAVLHAYTQSISTIWIVCVPIAFVGLLSVLVIRNYSLQRAHANVGADGRPEESAATKAEGNGADRQRPSMDKSGDLEGGVTMALH